MTRSLLVPSLAVFLCALFLVGCGRSSVGGTYQSVGSEDKFKMTLELRDGGSATLSTHSNLGNSEVDRAVKASMAIADGRWATDNTVVTVSGNLSDGKAAIYRFVVAPNGDLFWDKNGARFARAK